MPSPRPRPPAASRVRRAAPAEHRAVGDLTLAAYASDGLLHGGAGAAAYAEQLQDAGRRGREAELLVAVEGDQLLGTVTFCRAGSPYAELACDGEAEFRMLAVSPVARGRGVGATLVRACLDRARGAGDRAVVISTMPAMSTAHRIYERLGFVRIPGRDWAPVPGVDLIAYARSLEGGSG